MDTNIKFDRVEINDEISYIIKVYEDNIENLFKKIKKTIFDICLVKWGIE